MHLEIGIIASRSYRNRRQPLESKYECRPAQGAIDCLSPPDDSVAPCQAHDIIIECKQYFHGQPSKPKIADSSISVSAALSALSLQAWKTLFRRLRSSNSAVANT
jgi:hypothetical protein